MTAKQPMLTTIDNPHNPHTDYDKWYHWDTSNGYHTTSYLARLLPFVDEEATEEEIKDYRLIAMWEIMMMDDSHTYVLI